MSKLLTLIVEDSPTHRQILRTFLTDEGFIAFTVNSAASALRFLGQFKPDVLITNLSLTDMPGLELIQHVRNTKLLDNIPIVAISNTYRFQKKVVTDAGASALLHKPLDLTLLSKTLIRVFGKPPDPDDPQPQENLTAHRSY